jgi:hypothetical protein
MTIAQAVKERPILFSSPMVLKLLDGSKTQTRRIVKPQPEQEGSILWWKGLAYDLNKEPNWMEKRLCPYGQVGDRLWCKETWAELNIFNTKSGEFLRHEVIYRAENPNYETHWNPSIFMPRKYSRIILDITGVKVERVEDCSEEDAIAEGFSSFAEFVEYFYKLSPNLVNQNPWCWCISFKTEKGVQ